MKKLFITLAIVLWPVLALGGPFLVCDPDPNATHYLVKLDTTAEVQVPAPLKFDLGTVSVGAHKVEVKAKNTLWGATSSATPFEFTRPSLSITNIHLEP